MDILKSLLLGIIQGLTEFLPVSSSAHLLFPNLLFNANDLGLSFDIATHAGTLLAVMIYFWTDIKKMLFAINPLNNANDKENRQLFIFLIAATIPIVVIGFLSSDYIVNRGFGIKDIAWANIVFAGILLFAYKFGVGNKRVVELSILAVFFIGFFQAFALIPGASRSGTAMTAALLIGLSLKDASKFAFLLSIPTILGALVFLIIDSIGFYETINLLNLLIGFSVSAVFAFYTIKFFLAFIEKIGMYPFVIYRFLLGLALMLIA